MKTSTILLLAIAVLPLAATAFACGQGPDDNGTGRLNTLIVLAGDKDRGHLGVSVDDVTPKLARRKSLKVDEGVYVHNVEEDSPAESAGIKEGDVIVEFDGKKISDNDDLISEVRKTKPGTEVAIAVNRYGEKKILKATIDELPREYSSRFTVPVPPRAPRIHIAPRMFFMHESAMYGLTLEELNRRLGEYFGAPNGRGVLVKNVKRSSDAEKAGFKAGDVIMKVGKDDVTDVDDIWRSLDDYKEGEKAEFEVLRKGTKQKLSLTVEERDRDLSIHRFNHDGNDDDLRIDFFSPEGHREFRREVYKFKREVEKLKDELHDNMIELRNTIKQKFDRARAAVNV